MTKTTLLFCFLLTVILAAPSCKKEQNPTIIQGRITDRKTGQPIAGASIVMTAATKNDFGNYVTFTPSCQSDTNGEYRCTFVGDYQSSDVGKDRYIIRRKSLPIMNGQENKIDISLVPNDGFLRLKIENITGQHDTIYAYIYSPIESIEKASGGINLKTSPVILQIGESYTEVFNLASPEIVSVRWGFEKPIFELIYTSQDSILVVPKDTSIYILSY